MLLEKKNSWNLFDEVEKSNCLKFAEDYKFFLNNCKTERECITFFEEEARKKGFKYLDEIDKPVEGSKIIIKNKNKNIILMVIGKKDIRNGFNIVSAHADCPRLDLKPVPLIEENGIALLKTHYYGGIKKYQWLNIPLAIHGVIVKKDGTVVNVSIGSKAEDPVFTICDILPHLAHKIQGEKKLLEGIEGEMLRVTAGTIPLKEEDNQKKENNLVKKNILKILNEKYNITEEDFISSELEIVPAYPSYDVGLDRSLIGAYGHDDRCCSYASFRSLLDLDEIPEKTSICYIVDKEEIGSYGIAGIRSKFLVNTIEKVLYKIDNNYKHYELNNIFENSFAISADVLASINPVFKEAFDSENSPKLGYGIFIEKYTGSRGKSGASDANAETVGKLRKLYNEYNINWQSGVLGKVDEGGGGTVALYLAEMGIETIDSGIPLDGMHSPFELISKADLWMAYKAYKVFYSKF